MKRSMALILIIAIFLVSIVSCSHADTGDTDADSVDTVDVADTVGDDSPGSQPHDYTVGSNGALIWGDTVYYYDSSDRRIKYQNVKDVQDTGKLLYDGDDEFAELGSSFMLVDEYATIENNGYPVLILAPFSTGNNRILSFNTRTNERRVIMDDIGEGAVLQQLVMYRDTIFYTTFEIVEYGNGADTGLHRVDRDGSGYDEWYSQTDGMNLSIGGIHNDTLYFVDSWSGSLFTCDPYLQNVRSISDTVGSVMYVNDEYVYCTRASGDNVVLCRCDIDDMSQYDVLLEESTGTVCDGIFYYYSGANSMCAYDLATGETRTVYDESGRGDNYSKVTCGYSEDYIITHVMVYNDLDDFDINNLYSENYLTCIDLSSGEEWVIPY